MAPTRMSENGGWGVDFFEAPTRMSEDGGWDFGVVFFGVDFFEAFLGVVVEVVVVSSRRLWALAVR